MSAIAEKQERKKQFASKTFQSNMYFHCETTDFYLLQNACLQYSLSDTKM